MMVHPTDRGDEIFAHCRQCCLFEPLGINLTASDEAANEFLQVWESQHVCAGTDQTGLLLFGTDEQKWERFLRDPS